MFVCALCKTPQPSGTRVRKVVTHARRVEYRQSANHITFGLQTTREVNVCPTCPDPIVEVAELPPRGEPFDAFDAPTLKGLAASLHEGG